MALDPVVNFFRSEIATLPLASGGTSMVITTGDGNKLPNPSVDGAFNLTIYNASDPFVTPEIVRCTAKSGDTLTITRAQEGTTATNKTSGSTWYVELTPTAKTIQDIDSVKLDKAGGTMTGDLTIPDKIIHSGNTNTAIRFPANDTFTVETNGTEKIRATSTAVVVNESGLDQDFRVEGDTDANLLFVDASADKVGIGTTQAISKFQVNNIANATSFFSVVGGESIVSGNSVTVSKTQRGIMHIENNQVQAVGRNASLTFGLGGSQFVDTYYHISGAIRTETTGSGNLAVNPKMVFSVLNGASTTGTLTDYLEISHTGAVTAGGTVTGGKFAPTANTTAGNGMYLPTTNQVAIGTNGTEAIRVNASQNVGVKTTTPRSALDVNGDVHIVNSKIIQKNVTCTNATTTNVITVTPSADTLRCAVDIFVQFEATNRIVGVAKYTFIYLKRFADVKTSLDAILAPTFQPASAAALNYSSIVASVETTTGDGRAVAFNFTTSGTSSPLDTIAKIYAVVMASTLTEIT